MPGFTRGSPTAPEQDGVHLAQPLELVVGQDVAGAQVPLGAQVELDELDLEAVAATASRTFRASRDDLGAGAVAPDHADRVRRHGVTSSARRCSSRPHLQRAVDRGEVRARARLDDVGRDAAAGHPAAVDVELHDDVA